MGDGRLPASSRSLNFWIFPVTAFGNAVNTTLRGHLKCVNRARQNTMTSDSCNPGDSGLSSMKAHGTSPHFSLG